jgi:hypothetical protein
VKLSPCVYRPWLDSERTPPPIKLIVTNFGWNTKRSISHARSIRSRELWKAVVDHPLFDPNADWDEYRMASGRQTKDPVRTRYYVFLDVETCFETNYPTFGAMDYQINYDTEGDRAFQRKEEGECYDIERCPHIENVLKTPLFRGRDATLVYFDCRGNGVPASFRRKRQASKQLALASLSSTSEQLLPSVDQGLPPPSGALAKNKLSESQIQSIRQCEHDRPYLLTFVGDLQVDSLPLHSMIAKLDDPAKSIRVLTPAFLKRRFGLGVQGLMKLSRYVIVPRGDNHFSYNFVQALAAGSIPVVYSDLWTFPFRRELVDWSQCVVRVPEDRVASTEAVLAQIDLSEECRRRQYCHDVYVRWLSSPDAVLDGILQGLENARDRL